MNGHLKTCFRNLCVTRLTKLRLTADYLEYVYLHQFVLKLLLTILEKIETLQMRN